MEEIAPRIWAWRAAHPEWRPNRERVLSYALDHDGGLALVDPLLPEDTPEDVVRPLDELAGRAATPPQLFVTIPYHVRSVSKLARRWPGAIVRGHRSTAKRLPARTQFEPIEPSCELPFGVRAFTFGSPVRSELPLYFPEMRALAFGDAIVGVRRGLRVWASVHDERKRAWYESRFLPTLRPLLDLEIDHVLVTHGTPVIGNGRRALERALERDPVEY